MNLKLIIVDDNVLFRKSLKDFVEKKLGCIVIGEASNGMEYLDLPNIRNADIVLMDIMMEKMNGFEACKRTLYRCRDNKMIAITMHIEKVFLLNLVEAGFKGCVYKSDIFVNLAVAMENVMIGNYFFPDEIKIDKTGKNENKQFED